MNPAMLLPAAGVIAGNIKTHFMSDAKEPSQGGPNNDGFMQGDGPMATIGTALAGGAAGAALKMKDLGPDASLRDKIGAQVKGGLLGAGSGLLANMEHDAVHAEGGALKAALFGAGSNMLASKLQDGGPNMLQSAIAGGSTAFMADSFHDKLTEKGYGMQADVLADSTQGATLGYTGLGDTKGALLGGALGAVGGFATDKMTESQGEKTQLEGLSAGDKELAGSSRAEQMVAGQNASGVAPAAGLSAMLADKNVAALEAPEAPTKTVGDEGFSL